MSLAADYTVLYNDNVTQISWELAIAGNKRYVPNPMNCATHDWFFVCMLLPAKAGDAYMRTLSGHARNEFDGAGILARFTVYQLIWPIGLYASDDAP